MDTSAEWLRRRPAKPAKPMGSPRMGSNPYQPWASSASRLQSSGWDFSLRRQKYDCRPLKKKVKTRLTGFAASSTKTLTSVGGQ
eukprot:4849166-Amphidinium_carterae.1